MTTRDPRGLRLLALALANFAVGMGAFVVISVLTPVAATFSIDKPRAGWLMTIYAIVYAVGSPTLVALTGRLDRVRVLATGLALLALGAFACAMSRGFAGVLVARGIMALGGGLVTPVAAAVGVSLVDAEHRGRALSVIFGGLTFAQALGVPAGAWLGYEFGWRSVFVIVAMLAVAALVAVSRVLPKDIAVAPVGLRTLSDVLTAPRLVTAIAFTAFFIGGIYVVYTFLAPLLETRYGLSRDGVSAMFLFFGIGAILGNAMGGWLTDRIGPGRTLAALCCGQIILMPALTYLAPPLAAAALLLTLWSVCGWSFMVAQQARLATLAPRQIPVVFALNAAAIYAGAAVGSAIGGLALKMGGLDVLGSVGATVIALALASIVIVSRMSSRAVALRPDR